jgi:hypothetical protein
MLVKQLLMQNDVKFALNEVRDSRGILGFILLFQPIKDENLDFEDFHVFGPKLAEVELFHVFFLHIIYVS